MDFQTFDKDTTRYSIVFQQVLNQVWQNSRIAEWQNGWMVGGQAEAPGGIFTVPDRRGLN